MWPLRKQSTDRTLEECLVAAAFPETDEDDAIGKWLLTLTHAQREKIFRLVAYLNPPKTRRPAKREAAR
jgi:hypothetical protein